MFRAARVDRVLLQPAIAGAHHGQVREGALQLAGDAEVPVHAEQRVLGLLVVALVGLFERPADVRVVVRASPSGDVEQLDAPLAEPADGLLDLREVFARADCPDRRRSRTGTAAGTRTGRRGRSPGRACRARRRSSPAACTSISAVAEARRGSCRSRCG